LLLAIVAAGVAVTFAVYLFRPWTRDQLPTPADVAAEHRPTVALIAMGVAGFMVAAAFFDGRQRQRWVVGLEPNRVVSTLFYGVLGFVAVAVMVMALNPDMVPADWARIDPSDRRLPWAALISAGLAATFLGTALINGRRWRIARGITKLSNADPELAPYGPNSGAWRPGELTILPVRPFRQRRRFRRVGEVNVVGSPPIKIAYLRLFENEPRTRTFVQGAWREFGYVHLLRSSGSVSPAEYRDIKRSRRRFVGSLPEMAAELARAPRLPTPPGPRTVDRIANRRIFVWDRYGGYPTRPILCHGSFWQEAVDYLLDRMDLVVLDLSGFLEGNRGTLYELQRVVDRFPLNRVVFLRDRRGDRRFVEEHIERAWARMDPRSPNAAIASQLTMIATTDYFLQVNANSTAGPGQWRLKARRSETRRILAAIDIRPRPDALPIGVPVTSPIRVP